MSNAASGPARAILIVAQVGEEGRRAGEAPVQFSAIRTSVVRRETGKE